MSASRSSRTSTSLGRWGIILASKFESNFQVRCLLSGFCPGKKTFSFGNYRRNLLLFRENSRWLVAIWRYIVILELEYNGIFLLNKPFQRLVGTDLISPYFNYLVLVLVKVGWFLPDKHFLAMPQALIATPTSVIMIQHLPTHRTVSDHISPQ